MKFASLTCSWTAAAVTAVVELGSVLKYTIVLPFVTVTIFILLISTLSSIAIFAIKVSPAKVAKSSDNLIVTATDGASLKR